MSLESSPVPGSSSPRATTTTVEDALWDEMIINCTTYVFPPNQRHPLTGPRLYAFSRYGPAITTKFGFTLSGAHSPMLPHEHDLIMKQQVQELLGDVYVSRKTLLTDDEVELLMEGRNALFDSALKVTAVELATLLDDVKNRTPRAPATSTADPKALRGKIFSAISAAIIRFREERIKSLRSATPKEEGVVRDKSVTRRKTLSLYNQPKHRVYQINSWDPQDVVRALHRFTSTISNIAQASDANICHNVRCLRDEIEYDGSKEAWDPYCCLRKPKSVKK
eukprot:PhF_6_TR41686/c0_g1_i2/m.63230